MINVINDRYVKFSKSLKYKLLIAKRINWSMPYNLEISACDPSNPNLNSDNGLFFGESGICLNFERTFVEVFKFSLGKFKILNIQRNKYRLFIPADLTVTALVELYEAYKLSSTIRSLLAGEIGLNYQLKLHYGETCCDIYNIYFYNFELLKLSIAVKYTDIYKSAKSLNSSFNNLTISFVNEISVDISCVDFKGTHNFIIAKRDLVVVSWVLFKYHNSPKLLFKLLHDGICHDKITDNKFYLKLNHYPPIVKT